MPPAGVFSADREPGTLESLAPVWGNLKQAQYDFAHGSVFSGVFHSAMAVTDVFLVKSLVTGVARGVGSIIAKEAGAELGGDLAGEGGSKLGLGLDSYKSREGYRAWSARRGFQTFDELSPKMARDVDRIDFAMESADEIHFNALEYRPTQNPNATISKMVGKNGYTNYEYGRIMRDFQDKAWFWRGDVLDYEINLQPAVPWK
jgi:hypothetical protein